MTARPLHGVSRCRSSVRCERPSEFTRTFVRGFSRSFVRGFLRTSCWALRGHRQECLCYWRANDSREVLSLRSSRFGKLLLEALGFVVRHEPVDKWAKLSVDDFVQLMQREADAVVADAIFAEIV